MREGMPLILMLISQNTLILRLLSSTVTGLFRKPDVATSSVAGGQEFDALVGAGDHQVLAKPREVPVQEKLCMIRFKSRYIQDERPQTFEDYEILKITNYILKWEPVIFLPDNPLEFARGHLDHCREGRSYMQECCLLSNAKSQSIMSGSHIPNVKKNLRIGMAT